MLNWIVWNGTVYMYKNGFGIRYTKMVDMPKKTKKQTNKHNQTFNLVSI